MIQNFKIAVIGSGTMGNGIAHVFAQSGFKTLLVDIDKNELMHLVVKSGFWFSMTSSGDYSLNGCTVAPSFNYADFELAPKDWEPNNNNL